MESAELSDPTTLEKLVAARRATIRNLNAAKKKVAQLRTALNEANAEFEDAHEDALRAMERIDAFIRAQVEP